MSMYNGVLVEHHAKPSSLQHNGRVAEQLLESACKNAQKHPRQALRLAYSCRLLFSIFKASEKIRVALAEKIQRLLHASFFPCVANGDLYHYSIDFELQGRGDEGCGGVGGAQSTATILLCRHVALVDCTFYRSPTKAVHKRGPFIKAVRLPVTIGANGAVDGDTILAGALCADDSQCDVVLQCAFDETHYLVVQNPNRYSLRITLGFSILQTQDEFEEYGLSPPFDGPTI